MDTHSTRLDQFLLSSQQQCCNYYQQQSQQQQQQSPQPQQQQDCASQPAGQANSSRPRRNSCPAQLINNDDTASMISTQHPKLQITKQQTGMGPHVSSATGSNPTGMLPPGKQAASQLQHSSYSSRQARQTIVFSKAASSPYKPDQQQQQQHSYDTAGGQYQQQELHTTTATRRHAGSCSSSDGEGSLQSSVSRSSSNKMARLAFEALTAAGCVPVPGYEPLASSQARAIKASVAGSQASSISAAAAAVPAAVLTPDRAAARLSNLTHSSSNPDISSCRSTSGFWKHASSSSSSNRGDSGSGSSRSDSQKLVAALQQDCRWQQQQLKLKDQQLANLRHKHKQLLLELLELKAAHEDLQNELKLVQGQLREQQQAHSSRSIEEDKEVAVDVFRQQQPQEVDQQLVSYAQQMLLDQFNQGDSPWLLLAEPAAADVPAAAVGKQYAMQKAASGGSTSGSSSAVEGAPAAALGPGTSGQQQQQQQPSMRGQFAGQLTPLQLPPTGQTSSAQHQQQCFTPFPTPSGGDITARHNILQRFPAPPPPSAPVPAAESRAPPRRRRTCNSLQQLTDAPGDAASGCSAELVRPGSQASPQLAVDPEQQHVGFQGTSTAYVFHQRFDQPAGRFDRSSSSSSSNSRPAAAAGMSKLGHSQLPLPRLVGATEGSWVSSPARHDASSFPCAKGCNGIAASPQGGSPSPDLLHSTTHEPEVLSSPHVRFMSLPSPAAGGLKFAPAPPPAPLQPEGGKGGGGLRAARRRRRSCSHLTAMAGEREQERYNTYSLGDRATPSYSDLGWAEREPLVHAGRRAGHSLDGGGRGYVGDGGGGGGVAAFVAAVAAAAAVSGDGRNLS